MSDDPRPTHGSGPSATPSLVAPLTGPAPVRSVDWISQALLLHPKPEVALRLRQVLGRDTEILVARSAPEIEAQLDASPQVVFFDVDLPGVRVGDLLEHLRTLRPGVPLVGVSLEGHASSVRAALVAGARDVLFWPLRDEEVHGCLAGLRPQARAHEAEDAPPRAGVWVFCSASGGIGRTSLLLSCAHELRSRGHSVVGVDLDLLFGDLAFFTGVSPGDELGRALERPDFLSRRHLESCLVPHRNGFRVFCGPSDPAKAAALDRGRLCQAVQGLTKLADYVLVDLPPGLASSYLPLIDEAELLLACVQHNLGGLKDTRLMSNLFQRLGVPRGRTQWVVVGADDAVEATADFERVLSTEKGDSMFVLPQDREVVDRAILQASAVTELAPRSRYARHTRTFLEGLVGSKRVERRSGERPSLVDRFLGRLS